MPGQLIDVVGLPTETLAQAVPELEAVKLARGDQPRSQAVIEVVGGVGELVGDIGQLRFERAAFLGVVPGGVRQIVLRLMLDDPLAHFPCEIEARELREATLEQGHDSQ